MATPKKVQAVRKITAVLAAAEAQIGQNFKGLENDLKQLFTSYLWRDENPRRVELRNAFLAGAPLTGDKGIRRQLGAFDLEFFGRAYFPHYFSRPSPDFHRNLDAVWAEGVLKGIDPYTKAAARRVDTLPGSRHATAAPRGHAKSTNLTFKGSLHAAAYAYKHYIIILSDSSDQAESFLEAIKTECEENEALREDFGDLAGAVWRSDVLVLKNRVKIEAIGSGKKIRGRKHKNWRPDLIILDDIENDENVRTPEQRAKLESWFTKAVSKAGDDYTDIIYIGTILHYDSLLSKVLQNPGYKSQKYKAVLSFSDRSDLWDRWRDLYTDLTDPAHEETARAFFDANREAMLAGTAVLWADKLPYYDLMVMRVTEGDASFFSEEQNEPINPAECLFSEEWLAYYNEAEDNFSEQRYAFFGFVDPSLGKSRKSDTSAIIILAKDTTTGYMDVETADIDRRHPDKIITDILDHERRLRREYGRGFSKFGCESNQFQWFLKEELAKASARAGLYMPIEEVNQTSDKVMRIQTLQPDIKNHYIRFNKRHRQLLEQLMYFPMAGHDDGPDALEGCRTLAKITRRFTIFKRRDIGI